MPTDMIRTILGAACLLAFAPAVSAASLLEIVRACATQADDSARLQCYDRGVAQFNAVDKAAGNDPRCSNEGSAAQAASSQRAATTATATTPGGSNTTDQFGLSAGQVLRQRSGSNSRTASQRLTARIVTVSPQPSGHLVLRLDNGQVWEQTEDGPDLKLAADDPVTIDRGLLGAYWLSAHSRRLAIKVRRSQ